MRFVLIYDSNSPGKISDRYQIIRTYHEAVYQAIKSAIEEEGFCVFLVENTIFLEAELIDMQPDFAFNCSNKCIEDGGTSTNAPEILKRLKIPFTGSSGSACQNAYSKNRTKQILRKAGIRTPNAILIKNATDVKRINNLKLPLFIKPVSGGCSFGITQNSLIRKKENVGYKIRDMFKTIKQPLLLEEFLGGREFTVGIIGNNQLHVLPIMKFRYNDNSSFPFRSYALKMVHYEDEQMVCPAQISPEKRVEIEDITRKTFKALDCRDYARIDFRMNEKGVPYVLEVNALPNLMPETSSFAIMANKEGLSFEQLIKQIMQTAARRYSMHIA